MNYENWVWVMRFELWNLSYGWCSNQTGPMFGHTGLALLLNYGSLMNQALQSLDISSRYDLYDQWTLLHDVGFKIR